MGAAAASIDPATLSAVIDITPTPLWLIGSNGTVALANQAAIGMLGYRSVDDVIGAPSHDTLHEWRPDGSRYPPHCCPILEHRGSHLTAEPEWFITRDGQPIPVTWSTRPVGTDGSRLLYFADATERLAGADDCSADVRTAMEAVGSRAQLRADLMAHVNNRFRDPEFTASILATELHLSLRSVQQLLAEDGRSPAAEIRRARVEFAATLIAKGSSVHRACRASGFSDAGTFTRAFRRHYGQPPSEWARRAGQCPTRR